MQRSTWLAAALLTFIVAPAHAAPAVAVAPFVGPGGPSVRSQVVLAICGTADCSPQVPKGKAKKNGPAVLSGRIVVNRAKKTSALELSLVAGGREKVRKTFPLVYGKLSAESAEAAGRVILDALGARAAPPSPPPAVAAAPPVEASTTPEASALPASESTVPARPSSEEPSDKEKEGAQERAWAVSGAYVPPTFSASIGFDVISRSFSLSNLTTGNVYEYRGFPIGAPRLHVESYPLQRVIRGPLSTLGVDADLSFTLGLQSAAHSINYPSQLMRFSLNVKYRWAIGDSGSAVIPSLGYTRTSFSATRQVKQADGTTSTLQGLPDVAYSGLKLGVGGELPMLDRKLLLSGCLFLVPVFEAGEVISPAYFPKGSAWAFGASLGAGYRVLSALEIRLAFQIERYSLSFDSQSADTYHASGASDLFVGGTLGLGYLF